MGMDIANEVLCIQKCLSRISSVVQWSSSNETVQKSSSSSSSSRSSCMVRMYLECSCCEKSMGFSSCVVLEGGGISTAELFSSSELLEDNQHHTGLWHDWLVSMLCGVVGLKEMLSSLEAWWILEVHLRGVGMLKFSLPLSYPLSSNVSFLSKAALSMVIKQPNKTFSDCWHSRCVDVV